MCLAGLLFFDTQKKCLTTTNLKVRHLRHFRKTPGR
nr:MAG TPA: hypothetical protein [Caudoviricetes sp.]